MPVTLKLPKDKPCHPLTAALSITLSGTPRTKKTSQRIVKIGNFSKVIPSAAFLEYRSTCLSQAPIISRRLKQFGVSLPVTSGVSIKALIYRDANRGDWCGFVTALGDILQDMGVIENDVLIAHWDGTRLLKDAKRPRVELLIEPVGEDDQDGLFE